MSDTDDARPAEVSTTSTDSDVSLELRDVSKEFVEDDGSVVVAVDDLDLTIHDGEFVVFVGPSGCGKTTTLRMIAGLEEPTDGDIVIEGRNVAGLDPRERDIAMVFQNYALYPHKTVRDNIAFPLEIRKYPADVVTERVEEVARSLDIPNLLDRRPSELSGGQQQRVALGRAIVRDPAVFLFDEPLSNLDAKLRIEMRTELNKLHDRVGKTSVYVTHDQVEAMTLSDRVVVLNDGKLQQFAPPQELYRAPANKFVAGFIGEPPMNFFQASIERRDDRWWVTADAFDLRLPAAFDDRLDAYDGDASNLDFGIRPDDIYDADLQGGFDDAHCFDALVKVIEPMGPNIDLIVAPVSDPENEDAEFTARVSNDSRVSVGDTVRLGVDMEDAHLFDGRTGDAVLR